MASPRTTAGEASIAPGDTGRMMVLPRFGRQIKSWALRIISTAGGHRFPGGDRNETETVSAHSRPWKAGRAAERTSKRRARLYAQGRLPALRIRIA